jgi:hypothetical protein
LRSADAGEPPPESRGWYILARFRERKIEVPVNGPSQQSGHIEAQERGFYMAIGTYFAGNGMSAEKYDECIRLLKKAGAGIGERGGVPGAGDGVRKRERCAGVGEYWKRRRCG